jgi:hypothetical protein
MAQSRPATAGEDDTAALLQPRELRAFVEIAPPTLTLESAILMAPSAARNFLPRLVRATREFFFTLMPWIWKYSRQKALRDFIAAVVVVALLIPQAISYGALAGVRPANGLYSSIVPSFVAGILTTTGQLQWGIVAPTSILANSMGHAVTSAPEQSDGFIAVQVRLWVQGSGVVCVCACPSLPGFSRPTAPLSACCAAQVQLAFVAGVVLLALALFRMAWIADLISQPVIFGFSYGSALLIIASQLKALLGISYSPPEQSFGPRLVRAFQVGSGRACGNGHPAAAPPPSHSRESCRLLGVEHWDRERGLSLDRHRLAPRAPLCERHQDPEATCPGLPCCWHWRRRCCCPC